jgi:heme-degrading monooxygenase HmoA
MFIVISHHSCKPGQTEIARERIDKNGASMIGKPGFVYRYRIENQTKPAIVSTLTVWASEVDYKNFREKRAAGGTHDLQSSPFDRIESESYEICSVHGNPEIPPSS